MHNAWLEKQPVFFNFGSDACMLAGLICMISLENGDLNDSFCMLCAHGSVDNGIKRAGMPKAYLRYIMIILSV